MPMWKEIRKFSRPIPPFPKKTWAENLNEIQPQGMPDDQTRREDYL